MLLVKFSPALKFETCWGRSQEEAVLKTPVLARTELHRAVGVELYARQGVRATFGIHPTLTEVTSVLKSTNGLPICDPRGGVDGRRAAVTLGVARQVIANQVQDDALEVLVLLDSSTPDYYYAFEPVIGGLESKGFVLCVYKGYPAVARIVVIEAPGRARRVALEIAEWWRRLRAYRSVCSGRVARRRLESRRNRSGKREGIAHSAWGVVGAGR